MPPPTVGIVRLAGHLMSLAQHVPGMARTAVRSASVLDSPRGDFPVADAWAYWHQKARLSGRR